ncbi:MAG: ABC transporter permease subunit [Bacilli bacterium]
MFNFAFFKKEIMESLKAPRYWVLCSLFIFMGILSPVTGKFMNEIFTLFELDVPIVMPEPTMMDAWLQVYKNIHTLLVIVFLIMLSGTVVQEKVKGSVLLVLSKNISRSNFILSKFFTGVVLFFGLFILSFLISVGYTYYFFNEVFFDGWVYTFILSLGIGLVVTSLGIFVSVISKSATISALLGFAIFAVLGIFNSIPSLVKFNPLGGISMINSIMAGEINKTAIYIQFGSIILSTVFVVVTSITLFKKQEL